VKGLEKLINLFRAPFARAWAELMAIAAIRQSMTQRAPKGCQLRGFLTGITPTIRDKDGKIVRGTLHVTESEEEGMLYTKSTSTHKLHPPVSVWRQTWPDNGRKSKRHAQA
jgi:hypothetical protein